MTVDNTPMVGDSDLLRIPEDVCKPDSRNAIVCGSRTIEDQHRAVAEITLHQNVPEGVRIQFETTKNLYLYAWFVYRFYPVVDSNAYSCLELALRERFEKEMLAAGEQKREFGPGLKRLLSYAVTNEYLKDEHFSMWQQRTEKRARRRLRTEASNEMNRLGLDEIVVDESKFEINEDDRNHAYLATLLETMPWLRNHYAHGSTSLDNQSLGTVKLVSEIINQIYLNPESVK